jgi:hypothetical protein
MQYQLPATCLGVKKCGHALYETASSLVLRAWGSSGRSNKELRFRNGGRGPGPEVPSGLLRITCTDVLVLASNPPPPAADWHEMSLVCRLPSLGNTAYCWALILPPRAHRGSSALLCARSTSSYALRSIVTELLVVVSQHSAEVASSVIRWKAPTSLPVG